MRHSALVLMILCASIGCRWREEAAAPVKPPTVSAVALAPRTIRPETPIAGVLTPLPGKDVKVGALVAGRVDRVLVAEGDTVRTGQVLAHIEAAPLREHLVESEAQREQTRAALENARTRLARSEKLWRDGIAAKQEVDDARAFVVSAESAFKQARASGAIASVQLDRATIRAPIAGVVAAILVPAGQPVDGNGTPVIEIADTRLLDLRAPVPAARIGEAHIGQAARLSIEGAGDIAGVVEAIAPMVDTASNTVAVRVRVVNAAARLRGGQFARGALLGDERTGIAIPRSALLPGEGGSASSTAIVLPDGRIAHRALELGSELGDSVEVRKGLQVGERVIVAGGYSLPEGTLVVVSP